MHSLGVSVFGTTRDFDGRSNFHGPFEFMNDKDGATMIVPIIFKIPTDHPIHRPNSQLVRTYVRVSGHSCAHEVDAAADSEKLIAMGRRNSGQLGTGITVLFSADLEGKCTLPGCKRKCIMIQKKAKRQKRLDPGSAARLNYLKAVQGVVLKPVQQSRLRQVTGAETTEDWYLMRIGRVTSTGASRLLSLSSNDLQTRADASAADVEVGQAGLRQRCTNQPQSTGA